MVEIDLLAIFVANRYYKIILTIIVLEMIGYSGSDELLIVGIACRAKAL